MFVAAAPRWRRALRKNEVGLQRDHFLGEALHQLRAQPRPAIVNPNVAALCPPKLLECLAECGDESLSFTVCFGKPHQHTDPSRSILLRDRSNQPCGGTADECDELAPPHSITSSAIAITPGGMVRPSALAVFRLITNSYLDACTTGKSAGFSPLSTRPT